MSQGGNGGIVKLGVDRAAVFPRAPGVRGLGAGDLGKNDGERGFRKEGNLLVFWALSESEREPLKDLRFFRRIAGSGLGVGAPSMRGRFGVGARRFDSEKGLLAVRMPGVQRFGADPTGEKKLRTVTQEFEL